MAIKTTKPKASDKSLQTRIEQFIGSADGKPQKKQVIDATTQQEYKKFLLEILENDRDETKVVSRKLNMTMNEFIVEAIREKIEKHQDQ